MNILGLSGAVGHDASAALFVDGELVAAIEGERFLCDPVLEPLYPLCRIVVDGLAYPHRLSR